MIGLVLAAAQNADAPMLLAQNVAFGIIAALMIYSAIRVVTRRTAEKTIRAAMMLKATFCAT